MPQPIRTGKNGDFPPKNQSNALVALGSNYDPDAVDLRETVVSAMDRVAEKLGVIRAASRFFRTPAFPPGAGPDFVNAAILLETSLAPDALLDGLHDIERTFGRERRKRWAPRTLDLDLVGYEDLVLPDLQTYQAWVQLPLKQQMQQAPDRLILPHPRLAERAFVLVPLSEVAPEWCHPVTGLSVQQMLEDLPEENISEVVAL